MATSWTRRRFLAAALAGAAVPTLARRAAAKTPPPAPPFSDRARDTLRAAMDVLVPPADGMPGAGEAGVLGYLEGVAALESDVKADLRKAAAVLDRRSRAGGFAALDGAARLRVLESLEKKDPAVFVTLRDFVYEGYYTRPDVWKRLGFEFYGPERPGPGLAPFDEQAVARVRALAPLYRKVT